MACYGMPLSTRIQHSVSGGLALIYGHNAVRGPVRTGAVAIAVAVMVLLLIAGALGCPRASQELSLFGSEPSTLDPAVCGEATTASYIVEVFSGLVSLDADLEVVPDIAEGWDVSDDGTTYTFHLRDDVVFQNGREVTAGDFKYSMERAVAPETASPVAEAYLGDIVGVKEKRRGEANEVSGVVVIDDRTLEITIDSAKAYFLAKLTHPTAFVVDWEDVDSGGEWWRHPNGTGAFRVREWVAGQRLVLERNDRYYLGVPRVERVTFRFTGSSTMMYERGEIDITQVGTQDIERVLDPANPLSAQLVIVPQLSVGYIAFNVAVPPFDDEKVRQAFCHAVDKEAIIDILLKNTVSPAYGILPPGIPGHDDEFQGLEYDVARAQQLVSESSYKEGLPPVVLSVPGCCDGVPSSTAAIAWMWEENLGAEVEIELVEEETFFNELREGVLQAFEVGWIADYADAENFLDLLFHSESVENHAGYSNPDVDQLLEEARVEPDAERRLALYQDAEHAIVQDAPWLPLWFSCSYYLVKPYVKGFSPAAMVVPVYGDVWIER